MMASPSPVHDTPPIELSAYVPQPIRALSPTRPESFPMVPPVDVAAAMVPLRSRATAPTVPPRVSRLEATSAWRRCWRSVTSDAVSHSGTPTERANARAPSPTSRTWRRRPEDAAHECDRIRDARDGRDGTALEMIAFHDRCVHFDRAVAGENRAATRVEARVVLERAHRAFHGVQRRAAGREDVPAGHGGGAHAPPELVTSFGRIRAGAAVNDDRGHARRRGPVSGWRHGHHRVTIPPDCKTLGRFRA